MSLIILLKEEGIFPPYSLKQICSVGVNTKTCLLESRLREGSYKGSR